MVLLVSRVVGPTSGPFSPAPVHLHQVLAPASSPPSSAPGPGGHHSQGFLRL